MISSSNTQAAPDRLEIAFARMAQLRQQAIDALKDNTFGSTFNLADAHAITQQLKETGKELKEALKGRLTQVFLKPGGFESIVTEDYNAVIKFCKDNGIFGEHPEKKVFWESCLLDEYFRLNVFLPPEKFPIDSPYDLTALSQLSKLTKLGLPGSVSDPKELAKLINLQELDLCTHKTTEIEFLANLNLTLLKWRLFRPSPKRVESKDAPLDLAPFAKIRTLKELQIDVIEKKKGSSAGTQKAELSELTPLADLSELKRLTIQHSIIKKAILDKPLEQIGELTFSHCRLEDLSFVQKMPRLGLLTFLDCDISGEIKNYSQSLRVLSFTSSKVKNLASILRPLLGKNGQQLIILLNDTNGGKFSAEEKSIFAALRKEEKGIYK